MATAKRKLFKNPFAKHPKASPFELIEPWREYKDLMDGWDKSYYSRLLKNIQNRTEEVLTLKSVDSETVNIMMLGHVQSGKSSTINSIFTILDGRITNRAKAGSSCSFNPILSKHPSTENASNSGDINKQKEQKEIHCVMYCVDSETLFDEIMPGFERKLENIESDLKVFFQDRIVLVTNIDTICNLTRKDIKKIFYSEIIQRVVERAAIVFKVNTNHVFPIKNYVDEMEIDVYKNIPILLALTKAVDFGTDYLRDKADRAMRKEKLAEL